MRQQQLQQLAAGLASVLALVIGALPVEQRFVEVEKGRAQLGEQSDARRGVFAIAHAYILFGRRSRSSLAFSRCCLTVGRVLAAHPFRSACSSRSLTLSSISSTASSWSSTMASR